MVWIILVVLAIWGVATYWPIALLVLAGGIGYWWWDQGRRVAAQARLAARQLVFSPQGSKVDVVGESNYQGTLLQLAGGRTVDGPINREHIAWLVPEPTNKYDPNAIAVMIAGSVVGYLSKADAPRYQSILARAVAVDRVPAAHAVLTGGWDRGAGDRGSIGVVLYLGSPDEVEAQIAAALAGPELAAT